MEKEKGLIKMIISRRAFFYGHLLLLLAAVAGFALASYYLYTNAYLVLTSQENGESNQTDRGSSGGELKSEKLKSIVEKTKQKEKNAPEKELPNIF